jgi:hypothetical protein
MGRRISGRSRVVTKRGGDGGERVEGVPWVFSLLRVSFGRSTSTTGFDA